MRLLAALVALCVLVAPPADASRLFHGTAVIAAPQNFSVNFGADDLAGNGAVTADPSGRAVGQISIVSGGASIWAVDNQNQLMPFPSGATYNVTAPTFGAGPYSVLLQDAASHTWTATVNIVAHRHDWNTQTATQGPSNLVPLDTSAANQLRTAMSNAPENEQIVGRAGSLFNYVNPVGSWRVTRTTNAQQVTDFTTGAASFTGHIAPATASLTTSTIAGTTMTVPTVASGVALPNSVLTGSGVTGGTTIVQQLTGTVGGAGTYQVSISQTVASTTITATSTSGILTVATVASGSIVTSGVLNASSINYGTFEIQQLTGTLGGVGTYEVSQSQTLGSGGSPVSFTQAWTAQTAPDSLWSHVTCEVANACTIRQLILQGGNGSSVQAVQGYSFENLGFALIYDGINNFAAGESTLELGTGPTAYTEYTRAFGNTLTSTPGTTIQLGDLTNVDGIASSQNSREIYIHDNAFASHYDAIAINGNIGVTSPGSGYTNGTYTGVPLTGGSCSGATATIVVNSGQVQGVTYTSTVGCNPLDVVTTANTNIGGTGSNFFVSFARNMLPSNFFIVHNTYDIEWDHPMQTGEAAPVYIDWNFSYNHQYPNGGSHGDFEIRQYEATINGDYVWGDRIGNINLRAIGFAAWSDGQGLQSSGVNPANATFSHAKDEGNIDVETFACGQCIDFLDPDAVLAFNTELLDTTTGIVNPSAPAGVQFIQKVGGGGYNVEYNAVQSPFLLSGGGAPVLTNNVTVAAGNYGSAFTNPAFGVNTQTIAQVIAAWSMKPGGVLDKAVTGFTYNVGAVGTYFDFVNRISTAPF